MDGVRSGLGSARAKWNDYVGTAAADDAAAVLNSKSMYEIAGLDRDRWAIVGIDFSLGDASERLVVYAEDRAVATAEDAVEVPVTAFHVGPSLELTHFLGEAFQRVSVRLVSSAVIDKQLVVAHHAELSAAQG